MIFNETKGHVNTFLGMVGGCIPPCVRACLDPIFYYQGKASRHFAQPSLLRFGEINAKTKTYR